MANPWLSCRVITLPWWSPCLWRAGMSMRPWMAGWDLHASKVSGCLFRRGTVIQGVSLSVEDRVCKTGWLAGADALPMLSIKIQERGPGLLTRAYTFPEWLPFQGRDFATGLEREHQGQSAPALKQVMVGNACVTVKERCTMCLAASHGLLQTFKKVLYSLLDMGVSVEQRHGYEHMAQEGVRMRMSKRHKHKNDVCIGSRRRRMRFNFALGTWLPDLKGFLWRGSRKIIKAWRSHQHLQPFKHTPFCSCSPQIVLLPMFADLPINQLPDRHEDPR
eukprot:scaffold308488_cov22-Tisochrysis_lutea.AAC.1